MRSSASPTTSSPNKSLNTYIKCNPTLLGYEFARKTLDGLGFDYIQFDDHHFLEDLQWEDAVPMFHRLMDQCTGERGLEFGVKITNTFPVDVAAGELPSEEMYMSGRSLYPLTLSLAGPSGQGVQGQAAHLLLRRRGHALGAGPLVDCGIWPITMATTVLKPGGYQRFSPDLCRVRTSPTERLPGRGPRPGWTPCSPSYSPTATIRSP